VPTEKVFAAALEKLKARARLFGCIKTDFTSRVLLAKIYLYPLVSYLLNFYAFPVATIQQFIFPWGNLKQEILFASPSIMAQPALEHPRVYALRFVFEDENGNCHPLLERGQPLKMPRKLYSDLLLEKLCSLTPVTREGIQNYSLAQLMDHKIAHFYMLAICNCLPFHSRVHHFMTISSDCSICCEKDGDNPSHLFTKCEYGKMALLLLKAELHGKLPYLPRYDDMQDAFMNKELLTAKQGPLESSMPSHLVCQQSLSKLHLHSFLGSCFKIKETCTSP